MTTPSFDISAATSGESLRERLNAMPMCHHLGLRCTELRDGTARVELHTPAQLRHANGGVPGLFLSALADAAASFAIYTVMADEEAHATTDLSLHFIRAATTPTITAAAEVIRRSRHMAFATVRLLDDDGSVCATATGTWAISRPDA